MQDTKTYRVLKCESDRFVVDFDGTEVLCFSRKKVKNKTAVLTGDLVTVVSGENGYVLENVMPRKNQLVRPLVANIDQIIITVSPLPKPDFYLLDKLIINANRQNLKTVMCVNKSDTESYTDLINEIVLQYKGAVDKIICVSAKNNDVSALKTELKNKLSSFAGQSAVGKSSLINALINSKNSINKKQVIGDLSEKSLRGKNTTTKAEIIRLAKDTYITDTPGFSSLDIHGIEYDELDLYYSEFTDYLNDCKYHRCTHTVEPDCKIRELSETGVINKDRYERYKNMYLELKNAKKQY